MGNVTAELCRTLCTGTTQERTFLILLSRRSAYGASAGQNIGNRSIGTLGKVDFQNFRNDLTGFSDLHGVTNADITLGNKVLIVQRCIGHRRSCKAHRAHNSLRRQHTGSAHLHNDILHHGRFDLRRVLIGNCPLGALCRRTHALPLGKVADLDDSTVNIAGKLLPIFVNGHYMINDLRCIVQHSGRNDLEFQVAQKCQGFSVIRKFDTFCQLHIEDVDVQLTAGSDFRIQLAKRTGCGVSGVGKQRLTLRLLTLVQQGEALLGHEHFATDNEPLRCALKGHRDRRNGLEVLRHIFAYIAIATGRTTDKLSVFIFQRHR